MFFKFTRDFEFWVGNKFISSYDMGDQIEILGVTDLDPYNYRGKEQTLGEEKYVLPKDIKNLKVKSKYGESIWTSVPSLILGGILQEVQDE